MSTAVAPSSNRNIARYLTIVAISLGLLYSFTSIATYKTETSENRANKAPTSTNIPNVVMVDVLCMNLQDAQNLVQDQGVFLSRSKDASGQDRNQIYDRNWIVVGQNIPVGAAIGENEVVLSVLRDDEINQNSFCFGKTK
jgi:Flp pilus assembly protein CpaB